MEFLWNLGELILFVSAFFFWFSIVSVFVLNLLFAFGVFVLFFYFVLICCVPLSRSHMTFMRPFSTYSFLVEISSYARPDQCFHCRFPHIYISFINHTQNFSFFTMNKFLNMPKK